MKTITTTFVGNLLVEAFLLMLIMHILIIMQVVPSSLVWGGQITENDYGLLYPQTGLRKAGKLTAIELH